jgi:amino acid transporter
LSRKPFPTCTRNLERRTSRTFFSFCSPARSAHSFLRASRPDLERAFRVPAVPVVSTLGIIVCGAMIYGLGWTNWMRLLVWLVIGLIFYFSYGKYHSRINAPPPEMPEGIQLTR